VGRNKPLQHSIDFECYMLYNKIGKWTKEHCDVAEKRVVEGNTPNGGAKTKVELCFFDDAGNSVDEAEGTVVIILELDEDGDLIRETRGSYTPAKED